MVTGKSVGKSLRERMSLRRRTLPALGGGLAAFPAAGGAVGVRAKPGLLAPPIRFPRASPPRPRCSRSLLGLEERCNLQVPNRKPCKCQTGRAPSCSKPNLSGPQTNQNPKRASQEGRGAQTESPPLPPPPPPKTKLLLWSPPLPGPQTKLPKPNLSVSGPPDKAFWSGPGSSSGMGPQRGRRRSSGFPCGERGAGGTGRWGKGGGFGSLSLSTSRLPAPNAFNNNVAEPAPSQFGTVH